jgi:hypothetical protein
MSMVSPNREAVRVIQKLCSYGYQAPASSDFQRRLRRNVRGNERRSTKADAWNAILIAILTTQQPSGPNGKPAEVLRSGLLSWRKVLRDSRVISQGLSGFRFNRKKGRQLRLARVWLIENWGKVKRFQSRLNTLKPDDPARYGIECEAADLLADRRSGITGIGPKQARNFWQYLGYTVWTIPLDSRVRNILQAPPFSMNFESNGITKKVYSRVEQEVATLCRAVSTPKVYPVLLDSALFNMLGLIRDLVGFQRSHGHSF